MTTLEERLLQALMKLEEAIHSGPSSQPKPDLLPLFQQLDQLTEQLPSSANPALLHYLQKKSYQKARLWLQGLDGENQAGPCGHAP